MSSGNVTSINDKLYQCILIYEQLMSNNYMYKLEGGIEFTIRFKKENFAHLLGLHKLIDINIFKKLDNGENVAGLIYRKILKKEIKYSDIVKSRFFSDINDRIDYFSCINNLMFSEVIINFDRTKVNTKIQSNMILFNRIRGKYIHLFIHNRNHKVYPETFIVHANNYYIKKQLKRKVNSIGIENFKTKEVDNYVFRNGVPKKVAIS